VPNVSSGAPECRIAEHANCAMTAIRERPGSSRPDRCHSYTGAATRPGVKSSSPVLKKAWHRVAADSGDWGGALSDLGRSTVLSAAAQSHRVVGGLGLVPPGYERVA
jgi:hypothetical protein